MTDTKTNAKNNKKREGYQMKHLMNKTGKAIIASIIIALAAFSVVTATAIKAPEKDTSKTNSIVSSYSITSEDVFSHEIKQKEAAPKASETPKFEVSPETCTEPQAKPENSAEATTKKPAETKVSSVLQTEQKEVQTEVSEPLTQAEQKEIDTGLLPYGACIGNIYSAQLGVNCNLIFGAAQENLERGAVLHKQSNLMSYVVTNRHSPLIGAHNNTGFSGFKALEPYIGSAPSGVYISFTVNGVTYTYVVTKVTVQRADSFQYPYSTANDMAVFYTCYPFDTAGYKTDRMFVYCAKVG